MIVRHYPEATFTIAHGDDPEGVYLNVVVDVDDVDEVADVVTRPLVDMQVEEGLPAYAIPEWPLERIAAHWPERADEPNAARPIPALPLP